MAGIGSASSAIWITAGINALYLLACGIGILGVERLGRRRLLLISLAGVVFSLLAIAVAFQQADNKTPSSVTPGEGGCSSGERITNCLECLQAEMCGFCYRAGEEPGSCLAGNNSQHSHSGPCSQADHSEGFTWYREYCPTSSIISWAIIVALAAYLVSFAAGIAPIPWTVNAEIYPLWARAVCTSLATSTNWSVPTTTNSTTTSTTTTSTTSTTTLALLYC